MVGAPRRARTASRSSDRVARRVETRVHIELPQATRGQPSRLLRAGRPGRGRRLSVLRDLAIERVAGPGTALVEQQDVTSTQDFPERGRHGREALARRLARATRQHENRVRGGLAGARRHPGERKIDVATGRPCVILRHVDARALRRHGERQAG